MRLASLMILVFYVSDPHLTTGCFLATILEQVMVTSLELACIASICISCRQAGKMSMAMRHDRCAACYCARILQL